MSEMIQCDKCKRLMYTDSREEEKGAYIKLKADDPLYGYSTCHLCRSCYQKMFPWLNGETEGENDII